MSDVVICEHCNAFAAECETPVGDGSASLCWLCAHDVTFHEVAMGSPLRTSPCGCKRGDVYPADVLARMDAERDAATRYRVRPEFIGRDSDRRLDRVARVQSHRTGEHPAGN
jgi:hypothetical protein